MEFDDQYGLTVHAFEKGRKDIIRIGLTEYQGVEYIDIRTFFLTGDGYRPTQRGVTMPPACYRDLLSGVLELGGALGEIDHQVLAKLSSEVASP